MWIVVKNLLKAELFRLWRWALRKPEPPGRYADFRTQRDEAVSPPTSNPPDPTDQGI